MAVLGTWNFSKNSSVLVASHFHFWSILENNVSLIFQDTKFGILIFKGIWSPNHLPPPPFLPQKLWLWNFLTNIKSDYVPSAENWVILNQTIDEKDAEHYFSGPNLLEKKLNFCLWRRENCVILNTEKSNSRQLDNWRINLFSLHEFQFSLAENYV